MLCITTSESNNKLASTIRYFCELVNNIFLYLDNVYLCLPCGVMWRWTPPPPPPPPPQPATSPPASTGWRRTRGQDYWERALASFATTPTTTAPETAMLKDEQDTQTTPQPPPTTTSNTNTDNCTPNGNISPMDTTSNIKLSTTYYQTRNTHRSGSTTTLHNLDTGNNSTTCITHIGSFDADTSINNTFLASRSNNNTSTHQNISLTFDPADMSCTICNIPHNITIPAPDTPVTFILSDQNFPGGLGGGGGGWPVP